MMKTRMMIIMTLVVVEVEMVEAEAARGKRRAVAREKLSGAGREGREPPPWGSLHGFAGGVEEGNRGISYP
jgi:hypothetical protein